MWTKSELSKGQKLAKNFPKIFWIRALMNVKVINIVMSLFYLHRGLSLSQIFYLSMIWSAANLLLEVPSSYLADRWGRKKTILLGVAFGALYWTTYLLAHSFELFAVGAVLYATSIAFLSGTDEALLYDSAKELGQEESSLKKLGSYHASQRLFKIFAPILGVLIAHSLSDLQFILLICIDIVATLFALYLSSTLTEAHHYRDLEKVERGILRDAWTLLTHNKDLMNGIASRVLVFIASLAVWHYFQAFFTNLGVSLLLLGIGWSFVNLLIFLSQTHISSITKKWNPRHAIDMFNLLSTLSLVLFFLVWFFLPGPYVLYSLFLLFIFFENIRLPLYSEFFNKASKSYNRATTLSLTNFSKSILDIPIFLLAGIFVQENILAPYVIAFVLCSITILFFRLSSRKEEVKVVKQTV